MAMTASVEFFNVWDTYAKIVEKNYMSHRELSEDIVRLLSSRFGDKAVTLLDIGCGDCLTISDLCSAIRLSSYTGVDLSDAALDLARSRLAAHSFKTILISADMLSAFKNLDRFDVIYSSFAIHHLPAEQKYELFKLIHAHMKPDGIFVFVDAVRREGEDLGKYLERYCNTIQTKWIELSQEEKQSACDHIVHNDLVETTSKLLSLAQRAGLKLDGDPIAYGPHALFSLTKG